MRYLLFLLLFTVDARAFPPPSVDEVVSWTDNNLVTPKMVPSEIREQVIIRLRAKLLSKDLKSDDGSDSLVALGDEQTIESVVRQMREEAKQTGKYRSIVGNTYPQPLLIPYLAEDFFRDDGNEWESSMADRHWKTSTLPISIGRILDVLNILRRSPAFSEDMHKWSENTIAVPLKLLDLPKCRNVMRTWWRENEGAFTRRDYAAVKPGAPLGRNIARTEA